MPSPFFIFPLFQPSYVLFPFDPFTFAVAPLYVFKHSYYYTQTSLDCKGPLLFTQVSTEEHLILRGSLFSTDAE